LILYGCGDFITDYEGVSGYEHFRRDLALMYLLEIDPRSGGLQSARLVPMQMRRFRLERTSNGDAQFLCDLLMKTGEHFSTHFEVVEADGLILTW
jgi:poly-gamma-glutamate synthesis protein (capsule biosynthesis protein)